MILHERTKKLRKQTKVRFNQKQLGELGQKVIHRYRELHGNPVKIKVTLKNKEGKEFYWWLADYPETFFPEMDKLILESARGILAKKHKKKRPRIQKKP